MLFKLAYILPGRKKEEDSRVRGTASPWGLLFFPTSTWILQCPAQCLKHNHGHWMSQRFRAWMDRDCPLGAKPLSGESPGRVSFLKDFSSGLESRSELACPGISDNAQIEECCKWSEGQERLGQQTSSQQAVSRSILDTYDRDLFTKKIVLKTFIKRKRQHRLKGLFSGKKKKSF